MGVTYVAMGVAAGAFLIGGCYGAYKTIKSKREVNQRNNYYQNVSDLRLNNTRVNARIRSYY